MNKITKTALIDALATAGYIVLVGSFFFFITKVKFPKGDTFLAPVTFLMLFVLSAAITSYLVFGKPAQWYVDGKKKEAISLIGQTLGFFFAITVAVLVILLTLGR